MGIEAGTFGSSTGTLTSETLIFVTPAKAKSHQTCGFDSSTIQTKFWISNPGFEMAETTGFEPVVPFWSTTV